MIRASLFCAIVSACWVVAGCGAAARADDMVVIPPGHFVMGSSASEAARDKVLDRFAAAQQPRHEVTIASFLLAKHDVTRGEFAQFVAATEYMSIGCHVWDGFKWSAVATASWQNPGFTQTDRDPVVCVNRDDMDAYLRWYSKKTGRTYRLPTEAEWEYAARAGTATARYWGDDPSRQCTYANGSSQSYSRQFPAEPDVNRACSDGFVYTSPAGSYQPNAWGLYDMLGDVWQWTSDCWNSDYTTTPVDGSAATTGDCGTRSYRGGSWYDGPWLLRSATRNAAHVWDRYNGIGFRLAAALPATASAPATAASASAASASLLNADRALAAQSHAIGFVAAYSKAMAPYARKLGGTAHPAIGHDAILALMARYPADLAIDWVPQEAVVAESGELGFTWGRYVASFHDKTGKLVTTNGTYLDVWHRQSDGSWRWIADIGDDDN